MAGTLAEATRTAKAGADTVIAAMSGDIADGSLAMGARRRIYSRHPLAGELVTRIAEEAEEILRKKLPALVARNLGRWRQT